MRAKLVRTLVGLIKEKHKENTILFIDYYHENPNDVKPTEIIKVEDVTVYIWYLTNDTCFEIDGLTLEEMKILLRYVYPEEQKQQEEREIKELKTDPEYYLLVKTDRRFVKGNCEENLIEIAEKYYKGEECIIIKGVILNEFISDDFM